MEGRCPFRSHGDIYICLTRTSLQEERFGGFTFLFSSSDEHEDQPIQKKSRVKTHGDIFQAQLGLHSANRAPRLISMNFDILY
jgi:hypothetical protein